ncbi:MAG: YihY/virulence factor BrkB family protein [Actinomycetota bacterium]
MSDAPKAQGRRSWRYPVGVVREAVRSYGEDKAGRMALAIAYRSLFSLSPLLLLAASVAGFVFRRDEVAAALVDRATEAFGWSVGQVIDRALSATAGAATGSGLAGLAVLVWAGSGLFVEIRQSLNDIFSTSGDLRSGVLGFAWDRLTGFMATFALGLLLMAVLGVNLVTVGAERFLADRVPWLDGAIQPLIPIVSVVALASLFALQFQWFTVRRIPWRAAWWGGTITALMLVAGGLGLGWYVSSREQLTAGALSAGAIIFLFLVAALSHAYLFGAEMRQIS